ncbi:MAG: ASKHA domain-containing protein [Thermoguttaceae bacterium]
MASYRIRFLPDGHETTIAEGQTLLEAAQDANLYVGAICGGEGTCGKCRLIVRKGEVAGESTEYLTLDEIRAGYILACQVTPRSDLVVEIPPESRLSGYIDLGKEKDSERFRDFAHAGGECPQGQLDPLVKKLCLTLPEPTIDDPRADQERLLQAVAKQQPGPLQMGLKIARELPRVFRHLEANRASWTWTWDGHVTATIGCRSKVNELLCVERGDTANRCFGLAVDVGTTTVVAHLVDLNSGTTCGAAAKYNSQIRFGEDVVNRINYARRPGGAEAMHRAVVGDIDALIDDLVRRTQIGRGDILCVAAAGNTTMSHFLLGLETDPVRLSPFVPAVACPPPVRAAELGIRIHHRGILYTLPMVGSYVGGDITAGILACGMHRSGDLALFLDIGTNGEVVLGNREFLVACAASAGPAFEGGSVSCGMRAASGAVDRVRILRHGPAISTSTIDSCPPVGVCGTGLIDTLAGLFLSGIIDRGGRFQADGATGRVRPSEDGRLEFLLVAARNSGNHRDLVITQTDIDNLVRTKGAIYAAADSLVQSVGLSFANIQTVYIAGAFGNRLDVANCVAIGLLPDVPRNRIRFIGNGSVAGAKLAMLSQSMLEELYSMRERITYQELMVDPAYMERFTSACFLPHTDLSRFPTVMARLAQADSHARPPARTLKEVT